MFEFCIHRVGALRVICAHGERLQRSGFLSWRQRVYDWGVHLGQNLKLNQAESCLAVRMEAWGGSASMLTGEGRVVELPEFILGAAQVSLLTHLPRD